MDFEKGTRAVVASIDVSSAFDEACSVKHHHWVELESIIKDLTYYQHAVDRVIVFAAVVSFCTHRSIEAHLLVPSETRAEITATAGDTGWEIRVVPRPTAGAKRAPIQFDVGYQLCPKDGHITEFLQHLVKKALFMVEHEELLEAVSHGIREIECSVRCAKMHELKWILKKELGLW